MQLSINYSRMYATVDFVVQWAATLSSRAGETSPRE